MKFLIEIDELEITGDEDGNQSGVILKDSKRAESAGESNGTHLTGESDLVGRNYFEFHQLTIEKVENRLNEFKREGDRRLLNILKHSLTLGDSLVDSTDIEESLLGEIIEVAGEDHLKSADSLSEGDHNTG